MNDKVQSGQAPADREEPRFYLWHLEEIGVLKDRKPGDLWHSAKAAEEKVCVAIVDTGVDPGHPNLGGALLPQVDFGPDVNGVVYRDDAVEAKTPMRDDRIKALDDWLAKSRFEKSQLELIAAFLKGINEERRVLSLRDPSRYCGAHGTATAGLIGGRPPEKREAGAIAYYGVNPWCRILPIATPYSHELLPVIHGLIYAFCAGADVIHLPRGIANPNERAAFLKDSPYTTRIDSAPLARLPDSMKADQAALSVLVAQQVILESLLTFLAGNVYLVLTAGNDGLSDVLSYPAAAFVSNGEAGTQQAIIVGAKNANGVVSAYSNGAKISEENVILSYMPSNDSFAFDETHHSIDLRSLFWLPAAAIPKEPATYSPWGILSTDVRGGYGYAAGLADELPDDDDDEGPGALYTSFGGTSAASALMAGMISLLLQTGGLKEKLNAAGLRALMRRYYDRA